MKKINVRRARKKSGGAGRTFFHPTAASQPSFFGGGEVTVQTKCESCANQDRAVQRKEAAGGAAPGKIQSVARYIRALPGRGEAMPKSVQHFFEAKTGADLSSVRVHRDASAAESAAALHAQAYAAGEAIVFNHGKYAPETREGRELLSHELAHVLQQRNGKPEGLQLQMKPEPTQPTGKETDKEKVPAPASTAAGATKENVPAAAAGGQAAKEQEKAADAKGAKLAEPLAIADFATHGRPSHAVDFAKFVTFNGRTDATFNGGTGQTKDLKAVPAKDCSGCDASECMHVTGTLQITYQVSTSVTLPDVPSGLTPCQEKRVADAIHNKIKPHEDSHVAAFGSYNGTVNLPINYTGCKSGLDAFVQAMHDADSAARETAAKAKSDALDPFNVSVDLDCQDEPPKK